MEQLKEILSTPNMSQARRESLEYISNLSSREKAQLRVDAANSRVGDRNLTDGYDCKECLNRGYITVLREDPPRKKNGEITYSEEIVHCKCTKIRASILRMKRSGLEATIKKCTFDKYEASENWQKNLKEAAKKFADEVDDVEHKWFFIGGAVGCGKTHLCTAISRELLLRGKELRYMLWIDDSTKLKACVNDDEYEEKIYQLKNAEVLYIDDFFKLPPSRPDIRLAYEILNYRYNNHKLITIISSERHIDEIEDIDSAIGSRIQEMTKDNRNALNIERDRSRNYRTKDMVTI